MIEYRTPGVYFEQADNRSTAIGLVRTDIAGFVGIAQRGPLYRPIKVESWTQYRSVFGDPIPQAYLPDAVQGFFANGGATCWVVRVVDPDLAQPAKGKLFDVGGRPVIGLIAASRIDVATSPRITDASRSDVNTANDFYPDPGTWGEEVWAKFQPGDQGTFTLTLGRSEGAEETFRNLSLNPSDPRYFVRIINGERQAPGPGRRFSSGGARPSGSRLVLANDLRQGSLSRLPDPIPKTSLQAALIRLSGGQDGLAPSVELPDEMGTPRLRFTPASPSLYGRKIRIVVAVAKPPDSTGRFTLQVFFDDKVVAAGEEATPEESWSNLSLDRSDRRYVESVVNDRRKGPNQSIDPPPQGPDAVTAPKKQAKPFETQGGSRLIVVRDLAPPRARDPRSGNDLPPDGSGTLRMRDGSGSPSGGLAPKHLSGQGSPIDRRWGLACLEVIDEVSVVAIPDLVAAPLVSIESRVRPPRCQSIGDVPPPKVPERAPEFAPIFDEVQVRALHDAMVLHCEALKDRVAIIDVPPDVSSVQQALRWRVNAPTSRYAAAYFPRIKANDPSGIRGAVRDVPPCGHVAGLYAWTDRQFGVHKPPANAEIVGAEDVAVALDDTAHADLNDNGINAIRAYPGRGIRVFGARTLSDDPEWRFLNVRRLLLMIEQAIDRQTQWVVLEPHDVALRGDLDRVVRSFLNDLWRRGMLDGATPADAFDVRCDETTNPPEEVELGRLICRIGVRPPAPAEFVVVRIGKTDDGTLVLEG